MDSFAFIIHPIDPKRDVGRKFPLLGKVLSERQINFFSTFFPPVYISEIKGITSAASGKEIKGWLVACPFTAMRMVAWPEKVVYRKIIQTGRLAERLGAKMLGLGAFTSVVGDAGKTIANSLDIPVTTGDAYTVAVAVRAIERAAEEMGIVIETAAAAVVGATGSIGRVCAELLADKVAELILIGKREAALDQICQDLQARGATAQLHTATGMQALKDCQLILTVTSATHEVIHPEDLQPGCVVCDVARPRDVAARVAAVRDDVLVIDGGMVEVPGPVDFNFDFGLPQGQAYACMAETMALALEGRFEDYTIGKKITREQVEEIDTIAARHGFKLSGFRSFEKAVDAATINKIRQRAQAARSQALHQ
ncbi:MAG: polysaccharide biosynthesis protein [Anaerolineae bacterium]|nr:polysaccharide biosynthesis protein [Anaerolineae bacterium]